MKLTAAQLRKIIKEEVTRFLNEATPMEMAGAQGDPELEAFLISKISKLKKIDPTEVDLTEIDPDDFEEYLQDYFKEKGLGDYKAAIAHGSRKAISNR